ncbi:hypothetical protein ACJX0J_009069, partial [Zea mays]
MYVYIYVYVRINYPKNLKIFLLIFSILRIIFFLFDRKYDRKYDVVLKTKYLTAEDLIAIRMLIYVSLKLFSFWFKFFKYHQTIISLLFFMSLVNFFFLSFLLSG